MKKIIFVFCFFLMSIFSFSQDNIYLEYNNNYSFGGNGSNGYDFAFSIKSLDPRFKFDSYSFHIPNGLTFDKKIKLEELRKEVDFNINRTLKTESLSNISSCITHESFSLAKSIYLVMKEGDKMYYWKIFYKGTIKDTILFGYQGKI